jgi:hypothetical protein
MPIEVQIYLAKFLPDSRRGEPRNVGLVVRTAANEVLTKFLLEGDDTQTVPKQLDLREYGVTVGKWKEAIDKYGVKALQWVGKRKKQDQRLYLEFCGGEMVNNLDFDRLFEELVL